MEELLYSRGSRGRHGGIVILTGQPRKTWRNCYTHGAAEEDMEELLYSRGSRGRHGGIVILTGQPRKTWRNCYTHGAAEEDMEELLYSWGSRGRHGGIVILTGQPRKTWRNCYTHGAAEEDMEELLYSRGSRGRHGGIVILPGQPRKTWRNLYSRGSRGRHGGIVILTGQPRKTWRNCYTHGAAEEDMEELLYSRGSRGRHGGTFWGVDHGVEGRWRWCRWRASPPIRCVWSQTVRRHCHSWSQRYHATTPCQSSVTRRENSMSETTTTLTNGSLTNCIEEHGGINNLIYISRYCTKKCKVKTLEIKSSLLFSVCYGYRVKLTLLASRSVAVHSRFNTFNAGWLAPCVSFPKYWSKNVLAAKASQHHYQTIHNSFHTIYVDPTKQIQ